MSNESKIRKDRETDKPKYDKFEDYGSRHTHQWGGYSKSTGKYYEGGHGENIDSSTKSESGKSFRKSRGD